MSIEFVSVRRKDKYIYRAFDFLPANCFETLILATDLKKIEILIEDINSL